MFLGRVDSNDDAWEMIQRRRRFLSAACEIREASRSSLTRRVLKRRRRVLGEPDVREVVSSAVEKMLFHMFPVWARTRR